MAAIEAAFVAGIEAGAESLVEAEAGTTFDAKSLCVAPGEDAIEAATAATSLRFAAVDESLLTEAETAFGATSDGTPAETGIEEESETGALFGTEVEVEVGFLV